MRVGRPAKAHGAAPAGGAQRVGGALVLTWSRTQTTVVTSSAEAELNAMGSGAANHSPHRLAESLNGAAAVRAVFLGSK